MAISAISANPAIAVLVTVVVAKRECTNVSRVIFLILPIVASQEAMLTGLPDQTLQARTHAHA